jgi:hypothetical protein
MAVYLGSYRAVPGFVQETQDQLRRGAGGPNPAFLRLVRELPERLPAGCRILGSYTPLGGAGGAVFEPGPPAVMIVESDDPAHLGVISQHYSGYLAFLWVPATVVGASRQERDRWAAEASGPIEDADRWEDEGGRPA